MSPTPPPSPALETSHTAEPLEKFELPTRATFLGRVIILLVIILPFVGLLSALALSWGWGFTWLDLGLLVGGYLLTALGVTVGFHRHFTHRSFETYAPIRGILAVLGSMSLQGSLLRWVAWHRRHHQHSDGHDDPHTPHIGGSGWFSWLRGWWHSHIGWFFKGEPPDLHRYVADLKKSRIARWTSAMFPLWAILGILIPFFLGLAISGGSWLAAWRCALWAGAARIFLVHHVTWSVNSICHLWGHKPFKSEDESRNNFIIGLLALGEGWHNTHHAFPTSARHGLRWWQIDLSYYFIRGLEICRLAWNVRRPSEVAIAAAKA